LRKVSVSVPATIANLGSGFDTIGIAVDLRNVVTIEENDHFEVFEKGIPLSGEDLIAKTVKAFLKEKGESMNIRIVKRSVIPLRKGLGSSAAAIVSALGAIMAFTGSIDLRFVFNKAVELEGHPDNVAPAVYGGLRVSAFTSKGYTSLEIDTPFKFLTVFVPPFETSTEEARGALQKKVLLSQAVFNLQRLGILLAGFANGKIIKEGFEDKLHQRLRLLSHPEAKRFFEYLNFHLNLPTFLCGSGPSIGVIGRADPQIPSGWKKMELNVSKRGLKIEN